MSKENEDLRFLDSLRSGSEKQKKRRGEGGGKPLLFPPANTLLFYPLLKCLVMHIYWLPLADKVPLRLFAVGEYLSRLFVCCHVLARMRKLRYVASCTAALLSHASARRTNGKEGISHAKTGFRHVDRTDTSPAFRLSG